MPRISKFSPLVLLILDGWGFSKQLLGNAIRQSKTPNLDQLRQKYPFALLQASGLAVGMDWGEAGNSEIGHLTIGAGRVIEQYSLRINKAIKNGEFFTNPAFSQAIEHANNHRSNLHLLGLLTSGSVHASFDHLLALLKLAGDRLSSQQSLWLHLFLDGRDSGQHEAIELLQKLTPQLKANQHIATVIGRDFAMDRDNNWSRTEAIYNLITKAQGRQIAIAELLPSLETDYKQGLSDSDIPPTILTPYPGTSATDTLIFFNFREDSMRQLVHAFVASPEEFHYFPIVTSDSFFVGSMTKYLDSPLLHVAFPPPKIQNSLAEIISGQGLNQLHIAETEKYAHVTYFFNGLAETKYSGETDVFIKSQENPEQHPEMKAKQITDHVLQELDNNNFEFMVINFANGDILAHEGNFSAAKQAVIYIDELIGQLSAKILDHDGVLLITADHGNVEAMNYKGSGETETKHETNPVPFYLIGKEFQTFKSEEELQNEEKNVSGILADVAPTILAIMEISQPLEMTGQNLLPLLRK